MMLRKMIRLLLSATDVKELASGKMNAYPHAFDKMRPIRPAV
jgi:hypothetical protein